MDIWPKVLKVMNLVEDSHEVVVENVMNIVVHPKSQAKSFPYLVSSSVKGCSSLSEQPHVHNHRNLGFI